MSRHLFDRAELNRMYRYCFALTNDEDAAFDLLQDGLERYLRSASDAPAHPMAFLRRILRNRFIDGLRARGARPDGEAETLDDEGPSDGLDSLDGLMIANQELERIWSRLDPFERELLTLWAVEGLTMQEAAEALGLPLGTVAARVHRMRRRLSRLRDADEQAGHAA